MKGADKLSARISAIAERAKALQSGKAAEIVNQEHARQRRSHKSRIPRDKGDLQNANCDPKDPRRRVAQNGGQVRIYIDLPQAKSQAHRMPRLDPQGFSAALGKYLFEGE